MARSPNAGKPRGRWMTHDRKYDPHVGLFNGDTSHDSFLAPMLPRHDGAEHCVLGTLLRYPELFSSLRAQLTPDDFIGERSSVFYKMLQLCTSDLVLIADAFRQGDRPELVAYVSDLIGEAASPGQIQFYVQVLRTKSIQRRRIRLAELAASRGYDGATEAMLAAIRESAEVADYVPARRGDSIRAHKSLAGENCPTSRISSRSNPDDQGHDRDFSWRGVGKTMFALGMAGAVSSGCAALSARFCKIA